MSKKNIKQFLNISPVEVSLSSQKNLRSQSKYLPSAHKEDVFAKEKTGEVQ